MSVDYPSLSLFVDAVKSKGGRVFLHCHAGISRSATVCIAYIMKHLAFDLSGAYDHVKGKRPRVSPNLHFMGQLVEFQRRLHCVSECKAPSGAQAVSTCCLPEATRPATPLSVTSVSVTESSAHCTPYQPRVQQVTVPTRPNRLSLPSVCSKPQDGTTTAVSTLIAADVAASLAPSASRQSGEQSISAPASLISLRGCKPTTSKQSEMSYTLRYPSLPPLHQRDDSTSSVSLPTTPHSAFKDRLPTLANSGSSSWIHSHCLQALQLSPCRVVAACLDYRCISVTTNKV